jgi:hypothetical protein
MPRVSNHEAHRGRCKHEVLKRSAAYSGEIARAVSPFAYLK